MRTVIASLLLAATACANPLTTPAFDIGRNIRDVRKARPQKLVLRTANDPTKTGPG